MGNLSDSIERYLMRLLEEAEKDFIEIRRRELARIFKCVPSQINYVISTRFTEERGYIVESRRGEGGFIRIVRIDRPSSQQPLEFINRNIGDKISENEMDGILYRLREAGLLEENEVILLKAILNRELRDTDPQYIGYMRARILKALLSFLLTRR